VITPSRERASSGGEKRRSEQSLRVRRGESESLKAPCRPTPQAPSLRLIWSEEGENSNVEKKEKRDRGSGRAKRRRKEDKGSKD